MSSKRWLKTLLLLFVLSALFASLGCQKKASLAQVNAAEHEQIKPTEKLIAAPDTRLLDLPVPLGAEFKAASSSSYETGGHRTVNYNYVLWAKPVLVRLFYKDNMPLHGWQPIGTMAADDVTSFSFEKAQEFCNVTVGPRNWYFQTLIRIEIQPVGASTSTFRQGSN